MKVFRKLITIVYPDIPNEPIIFNKEEVVELIECQVNDLYASGIGVLVASESYREWICASFLKGKIDEEE